jgi:hypothetical protein
MHTLQRSFRRLLFRFGALVLVLGATSLADASENYPAELATSSGRSGACGNSALQCLVCHNSIDGGEGTADQPFVDTLEAQTGFADGEDRRGLREALTALFEDAPDTDTDGDGVTDRDELAACRNPSGPELTNPPSFGCDGAHIGSMAPGASAALLVLALLSAGRRRTRR